MVEKTLFLAWQDKGISRRWFPVGRLDADVEDNKYRFRYVRGARRAAKEVGFPLIVAFPNIDEDYKSPRLFSTFSNRVMRSSRPDFKTYLDSLALAEDTDPMDMLAVTGGYRMTDSYEVFRRIAKQADGSFSCRFLPARRKAR